MGQRALPLGLNIQVSGGGYGDCAGRPDREDYASEIALWQDTLEKSPHKARVHNNLGYAYQLAHRTDDARREFMIALQIDPHHVKAHYNLERLNLP